MTNSIKTKTNRTNFFYFYMHKISFWIFHFEFCSISIVAVTIFIVHSPFSYFVDPCWVHRLIWSQWPPNWCSSVFLSVLDHHQTHDPCVHRIWHIAPPFVYGLDFWESIINWCLIVFFDVFCLSNCFFKKNWLLCEILMRNGVSKWKYFWMGMDGVLAESDVQLVGGWWCQNE